MNGKSKTVLIPASMGGAAAATATGAETIGGIAKHRDEGSGPDIVLRVARSHAIDGIMRTACFSCKRSLGLKSVRASSG